MKKTMKKTMEDTGLQGGAADLRDQQLLLDYTLKVQDQEFRVHKFVLASVSDYFRAMFCGSMSESTKDMVELKEINAEHMSQLLDFIYSGKSSCIKSNTIELLKLADFFQMAKVIEKCREHLMTLLSVRNCINLLTTFNTYSMEKEARKVTKFIKGRLHEVMKYNDVSDVPPVVMKIIVANMENYEWDLFQYVRSWINADLDNRNEYTNDFMSQLNFNLMPKINTVKEMDIFTRNEGPWKDRVEKASVYHKQTILQKVTNNSKQRIPTLEKSPFMFIELGGYRGKKDEFSVDRIVKDNNSASKWEHCKSVEVPQVTGKIPFVLEVNNFLITCTKIGANQTWQVFDPLALSWTKMSNMPTPKDNFAMVYHDKRLYVLGGKTGSGLQTCITDTMDEYSFQADSWSSTKKLSHAVQNHAACVLNGDIYISGGETAKGSGSHLSTKGLTNRLDCLDTSTLKWEKKAAMHKAVSKHSMSVMTIRGQEAIVVIDQKLEVRYYNTTTKQWSKCRFVVEEQDVDDCTDMYDRPYKDVQNANWHPGRSMIMVDGNTVYLFHMYGKALVEEEDDEYDWYGTAYNRSKMTETEDLCVKWRVDDGSDDESDDDEQVTDENKQIKITQFGMEDFKYLGNNKLGGVLAFSAYIRRPDHDDDYDDDDGDEDDSENSDDTDSECSDEDDFF